MEPEVKGYKMYFLGGFKQKTVDRRKFTCGIGLIYHILQNKLRF